MATITGLTAARMQAIEDASVVDGEVVGGNLILTKFDGTPINAGSVIGPQGPQGVPGQGVPVGGSAGQLLSKVSGVDYATGWINPVGASWEKIAENVFSGAATFVIGSIPQTYKHLRLLLKARTNFANYVETLKMRLGGDGSANYDSSYGQANNSVLAHVQADNLDSIQLGPVCAASAVSNVFSTFDIRFLNYRDAAMRQILVQFASLTAQNGADQKYVGFGGGLWQNANVDTMNQITLLASGIFQVGCSFTLEGRV